MSALLLALGLLGCGEPPAPPVEVPAVEAPEPEGDAPGARWWAAPRPDPSGRPRHLVVVLLDTVRADVLDRADVPNLRALASGDLRVDRAWAPGSWTAPSVTSLFTGAFVRTHGWDLPTGDLERYPPLPSLPTLAEVLRAAGFATRGLHANAYLATGIGFERGFEEWRRQSDLVLPREVRGRVGGWSADGRRQFLYVHFIGPHTGLSPSPEARARHGLDAAWFPTRAGLLIDRAQRDREPGVRDAYRAAYWAVAEDTDRRLGEVLDALAPHRGETLLVVLADHGEELGETGVFGHGWSVAETLLHVPLFVAGPGIRPGTRPTATLAELADLATDALGVDHPWPVQHPWTGPLAAERHGKRAILAQGRWKGAWSGADLEVTDLARGGAPAGPEGEAAVRRALEDWMAVTPPAPPGAAPIPLDETVREALGALGYAGS